MKVLELFSGIGGMHYALKASKLNGEIICAADINTTANQVYKFNFPNVNLLEKNIQSFTADFINSLNIDTILMSPPCQPFTRVGNKKDLLDNRCKALSHIINILPNLNVKHILLENVKGFETSVARNQLVDVLCQLNFKYREILLSPLELGIPNNRLRYYLLAKKDAEPDQDCYTSLIESIKSSNVMPIAEFVTLDQSGEKYLLPETILQKRAWILDIVTKESIKSCCFTKAYGRYIEGTGSFFCPLGSKDVEKVYECIKAVEPSSCEFLELLKTLKLRYFTPTEVKKILMFPEEFDFPTTCSIRKKYMLLGNSINVKVVSELINLMVLDNFYE